MTIPELARKAAEQLPDEMVLSEWEPWELEQIEKVIESALNELAAKKDEERGNVDVLANAQANLLCNINDTLRSRGFPGTFKTDERVIQMAQALDRALSKLEDARKDSERLEWMMGPYNTTRTAIDAARNQQS